MANNGSRPWQSRSSRPALQYRTLSSSLRTYSSPLVPRNQRRSQTLPPNGQLSPTHEAHESDPLLSTSPRSNFASVSSFRFGSHGGTEFGDDDDGADLEAEQTDEQADSDGLYPPHCSWTTNASSPPKKSDPYGIRECDVYGNIHRVRHEIINSIDDPYSLDQLKAPRMNISVVRPLVDKFYNKQDLSMVFCILVNRAQFIREQSYAAHHQTVNLTRALLCELLAEKLIRRYNEFNPGPRGLLKLANILVAGFDAFQGAPESVMQDSSLAPHIAHRESKGRHHHHILTALEVAIVSESKSFLAGTACQKVVDAIYRGKVVYSPSSYVDIIPDHYKKRPISLYDPRRAPVLNQYRLVVPRTRNVIEVIQFAILLVLYVAVMIGRETREKTAMGVVEAVFDVYACGWILDQLASILEHGWHVYTQNLWSFLDVMFSIIFLIYLPMRLHGRIVNVPEDDQLGVTALDVLSCAAPVLIPRLAFNVMSENMLFLSLRSMMGDFITLTALAIWCFAGFLLSLKWLHNGLHDSVTISKWMIFVWFGLDGTGINEAPTFHKILGPALMIIFAFLGNTLFLTILVSMLSNTFSLIATNAVQEIQYRRAVLTFMGVKSDAMFAFMPPFNLAALVVFAPLKFILTPRMFHTVYVFTVRCVNLPTLVILSWYERNTLWVSTQFRHIRARRIDWKSTSGPRVVATGWWASTVQFWDFSRFSAHGDLQAVFESDPPDDILHDPDVHSDHEDPLHSANQVTEEPDELDTEGPVTGKELRNRVQAQFKIPFLAASKRASLTSESAPNLRNPTTLNTILNNNTTKTSVLTTTDESSPSSPETPRSPATPYKPRSPLSTLNTPGPMTPSSTRAKSFSAKNLPSRRTRFSIADHDAALRAEFHDSEDEAEARNRRKSRAINLKRNGNAVKRTQQRKDSMIDYDHEGFGAVEANARLNGLEGRLERIEGLLLRVISSGTARSGRGVGGAGSGDFDDGVDADDEDKDRDRRRKEAKLERDVEKVAAAAGGSDEVDEGGGLFADDASDAGSPADAEVETALKRDWQKETDTSF